MYAIKCPWCGGVARRDPARAITFCTTEECQAACYMAGLPGITDEFLAKNSRRKLKQGRFV